MLPKQLITAAVRLEVRQDWRTRNHCEVRAWDEYGGRDWVDVCAPPDGGYVTFDGRQLGDPLQRLGNTIIWNPRRHPTLGDCIQWHWRRAGAGRGYL